MITLTELEFGGKAIKPEIRMLYDMKDVLFDRRWLESAENAEIYYMYRYLALGKKDESIMKEAGLRYDITVIPPRMLGCEYVKTAGHYHPEIPGTGITYPEIYEVLGGEAYYLLQKLEGSTVSDVILIKAGIGDKVIIPPGYGHITINASNKVLKMANWVARNFNSIYEPIKERGGGAYLFLKDGIIKNPKYDKVPDIRRVNPPDLSEIGFRKNKEMYGLIKDITKLEFLVRPEKYGRFFEKIVTGD